LSLVFLPIFGFFIGLVLIALGGGGGGFYVGILTAIFNVHPAIAASTSLATIIPTTIIGAYGHWKAGNVNLHLGGIMMISAIAGSVIGSLCSGYVPEKYYNMITGVILILLTVQMLVQYLKRHKKQEETNTCEKRGYNLSDIIKASFFGLIGGVLSGLVGICGTAALVAGLMTLGCGALEIVGTSVFIIIGISITGFLMHLSMGNIDWKLVLLLVTGTSTGALFAPYILSRFDKEKTEKVLPPVIIIMTAILGTMVLMK